MLGGSYQQGWDDCLDAVLVSRINLHLLRNKCYSVGMVSAIPLIMNCTAIANTIIDISLVMT